MSAEELTPAGLLIGFAIVVAMLTLSWGAWAWLRRRRSGQGHTDDQDDVVIDLTYLERAIRLDEEAVARRRSEDKPLFSQASDAQPDRSHRLPTDEG